MHDLENIRKEYSEWQVALIMCGKALEADPIPMAMHEQRINHVHDSREGWLISSVLQWPFSVAKSTERFNLSLSRGHLVIPYVQICDLITLKIKGFSMLI